MTLFINYKIKIIILPKLNRLFKIVLDSVKSYSHFFFKKIRFKVKVCKSNPFLVTKSHLKMKSNEIQLLSKIKPDIHNFVL